MDKIIEKIKEYSKNKKYVTGAAIVLVVVIALVFVINISTPKKTVKAFFKACENGDADKVLDLLYINEKAIEEEFDTEVDEYGEDKLAEEIIESYEEYEIEYEILSVKESTKTATVKLKLIMDDDEQNVKFYLKKKDGKWKIDIYKSFYQANKTVTKAPRYYEDSDY